MADANKKDKDYRGLAGENPPAWNLPEYAYDEDYEVNDISELYTYCFNTWMDDVDEYLYLGHTVEQTAKFFELPTKVIKQFIKKLRIRDGH